MTDKRHSVTMSLRMKMNIFIVVLLVVATLGIGIPSYIVAKNELEAEGKIILANAVDMALFIIEDNAIAVQKGELTEAEAQERVKSYLVGKRKEDGTRELNTPIDLGENGYFIAYSTDGYERMHPSMEGQNVWLVEGYNEPGRYIVQEQVAAAEGEGYVEYQWLYPGSDRVGKKISYSEKDPYWNWIVVATAYASDFNQRANRIMLVMCIMLTSLLVGGLFFSVQYIRKINLPIIAVTNAMNDSRKGIFVVLPDAKQRDELGVLVRGYNDMSQSLQQRYLELKLKEEELKKIAYYDDMTELPNLHHIELFVSEQMAVGDCSGILMLLDIRELKTINSVYGMSIGDAIIKCVGNVIRNTPAGKDSIAGKFGGNEFGIWLHQGTEVQALDWLETIRQQLKHEILLSEMDIKLSFSVSYTQYPEAAKDFGELLQTVNIAMQYGKSVDQAVTKYESYMYTQLETDSNMKKHAEEGLTKKEFYMVYQSKMNILTGEVTGVEALARWYSPCLGKVSPATFIPIINRTNLMTDFTEYVVESVFGDYPRLIERYGRDITVSINISPSFFMKEHFVSYMLGSAAAYQVPPDKVIIEITEDIILTNLAEVNQKINTLREAGMKISLDDFGTGYSSLNYLKKIILDEVKIDKAFVDSITKDEKAYKLFKSIVKAVKTFEYGIVAEGVEEEEQVEFVRNAGCNIVQGYYYSKPKALEDDRG